MTRPVIRLVLSADNALQFPLHRLRCWRVGHPRGYVRLLPLACRALRWSVFLRANPMRRPLVRCRRWQCDGLSRREDRVDLQALSPLRIDRS